jgi:hypothetical protein
MAEKGHDAGHRIGRYSRSVTQASICPRFRVRLKCGSGYGTERILRNGTERIWVKRGTERNGYGVKTRNGTERNGTDMGLKCGTERNGYGVKMRNGLGIKRFLKTDMKKFEVQLFNSNTTQYKY